MALGAFCRCWFTLGHFGTTLGHSGAFLLALAWCHLGLTVPHDRFLQDDSKCFVVAPHRLNQAWGRHGAGMGQAWGRHGRRTCVAGGRRPLRGHVSAKNRYTHNLNTPWAKGRANSNHCLRTGWGENRQRHLFQMQGEERAFFQGHMLSFLSQQAGSAG